MLKSHGSPSPGIPPSTAPAAGRAAREVDLEDVNSAHAMAVRAVPPGSRILDVGAGDGTVARALSARGCPVTAIEVDAAAARAAEPYCERVICADIEAADLAAMLPDETFDVALLLDVLEHLREPGATLRRLARLLEPDGRLVISVPNVTHAAVRLQLLDGRFPRTESGLLDRTHLHFFDRSSLRTLLRGASLRIVDELRVKRTLTQTEIPVDPAALAPEVLAAATADFDAETYQFIVIAAPLRVPSASVQAESLSEWLQRRAEGIERSYRELEQCARSMEEALEDARRETERRAEAASALADAKAATDALVAVLRDRLAEVERARQALEQRMSERETALASAAAAEREAARERAIAREAVAQLRRDLAVKDAYIAELRGALQCQERSIGIEVAALRASLDAVSRERDGLRELADHARRVPTIPRYWLADRVNGALKTFPAVHRAGRRLFVRLFRARIA